MVVELRYLGKFLAIFIAIVAIFGITLALGLSAHLGPLLTTAVLYGIGGCAFVVYCLFLMRKQMRLSVTESAVVERPAARIMPPLITVSLIGLAGFSTVSSLIAQHRGDHVSTDNLIVNGVVFISLAASAFRDLRRRYRGLRARSPFNARRLSDLEAAYAQPTYTEYRRAIAPLRNRGLGRLALFILMPIAMIVLAPHVGIGVAFLIAFAAIAALFAALHQLVNL